jgi:phenylalanyl-tRNA synthetase beta chain
MPRSVLDRARVAALLPHPLSDAQLDDLLFLSKAELEARDADTLTVSVTPDRLDLLSEGGLALHLQGALGATRGLPSWAGAPHDGPAASFEVDDSVAPLRPFVAGVRLEAPSEAGLDAGTLAEAIRLQEIVHATVGRDRRAASLGLYPLTRLEGPIRYALEPLSAVRFVPLDGTEEVAATEFFAAHPMAARYGAWGRSGDRCLTLRDRAGTILSLPPILNSRTGGEARVGDRQLLLESTGRNERAVRDSIGLLIVPFAAQGWSVRPMGVARAGGRSDDGHGFLRPRELDLPSGTLKAISGSALPAPEVEQRLARSRLGGHPHAGGWRVDVPPWRPDLQTAVDLVEDVVIAAPIRAEDGLPSASFTLGGIRPATRFRRQMAAALLGLGLVAPRTPVLVSETAVRRLPGLRPVAIEHPVSVEYAYLRDRLLISHLEVLGRNTRHAYPQRFAEVGPVLVRRSEAESGAETRYHASLVLASDTAGFADAAGLVDYLLRSIDALAVREPAELPGTIPGRAARARVAGEVVAEIGEIHPKLLTELGVPVPVAWAELDLDTLRTLSGGESEP